MTFLIWKMLQKLDLGYGSRGKTNWPMSKEVGLVPEGRWPNNFWSLCSAHALLFIGCPCERNFA